ncbi:uncharacterized protein LOC110101588 isoform X2 [Dendrobium catenatum]|uniref:PHD-type zinc finger plants domain-containing protein n=1 Tax=Dendrobium catenatum TaxID=906689 RepID=A0A2I0W1H2_9ASPA|nr:uncharacterized protein LOC110101588 isoform X2 [Dendrobium catenatum]PKU69509.1 hypothetical protein MA16_Dca015381 [Dendrobium catenatum]
MGSKGGGALQSPSSPSSPSVVCCMCGDRGLSRELFRCKLCAFRSQHNDLYPRAEVYRACNWCLREEAGSRLLLVEQTTVDRIISASSSPVGGTSSGLKLARGAFSPQLLNKPVKKQRLGDRRLQPPSDSGDRGSGEELSPGSGRGRQVFRGKARRYKLLEEFSS